ncbi:ABC transporter ATP-binding protein [Streptomyces luomodiensis]|uniref:ABC transporter ATP-binding protein n=1 Tax=Streptomyces luomodiensis TaxID=3026192 RepID=A0ABY9V1N6_9ACTN|nr:ABC transporter ATP-binding protein [Streptomyces sp. SCA4-21]WNE97980.1 ABC transporter ATP-binding protein [Streptomyces sp. SCA4-21]
MRTRGRRRPGSSEQAHTRSAYRRVTTAIGLCATAAPWASAGYAAITLVSGLVPVLVAWMTKLLIDGLTHHAEIRTLLGPALGYVLAATVVGLGPLAARYLRGVVDREVGLLSQDRLFTAVGRHPGLGRLEQPAFLDRLRVAQEVGKTVAGQLADAALAAGKSLVTVAGFLVSLVALSPLMAVVVLVAGVPSLVAQLALSREQARAVFEVSRIERREDFYARLIATPTAAKEIRLFGIGDFLRARVLAERRAANAVTQSVDAHQTKVQSLLELLASLVSGAGLVWAVFAAHDGTLTVGGVTMFVAAVDGVQSSLGTLLIQLAASQRALLMFDHYLEVVEAEPDLPVAAEPVPLAPLCHAIELRDVWFRYSPDHDWVLRGLNLCIPCGQSLALVGLNGAGKSTLVKLLCRFYDPTHGTVLWDGVDLRDVDPAELRERISTLFQDFQHYDMTAAENIGLGDLRLLDERHQIEVAAGKAGLHEKLARLPQGYDTMLSRTFHHDSRSSEHRSGALLSGGEHQRLALARAFLREGRDLTILDEPSAGLDAASEHEIHRSITRHRAGRTSLLISHRLGAVRDADRIAVLGDGRVMEEGSHMELMRAGGEYARLFTLQADGYRQGHAEPAVPTHAVEAAADR